MNNEIRFIHSDGFAPKTDLKKQSKEALYKVLRYILLGIGIIFIAVIAIPTVILATILVGIWSLLDCILSRLDK